MFNTRYNRKKDVGESYEPDSSLTQPGQSESLLHIVQRLTRQPDPTMRDLYVVAKATGQEFEDPSSMSDDELDERMERVVAPGDNMDVAEALLNAQSDLLNAQKVALNEPETKAERELKANVSTDEHENMTESA